MSNHTRNTSDSIVGDMEEEEVMVMKIILYICIWIVGGNCPMKVDSRTPRPDTFVRDHLKSEVMKTINLTQGKVALVDDAIFNYLNQFKWCAVKWGNNYFYAETRINGVVCRMHRLIMQTPKGLMVDHIDHNTLNNQQYNLRNCTHAQNCQNVISQIGSTSKYLGVHIYTCRGKWKYIKATIRLNGKMKYLGTFKTEELAAHAYDDAAKLYHGEFANLNFKD
ncbi:MAG: HNH endonuclease [Prolixibacteraceae bacterium]|nr:HNH endonuclease [Prolixibacteraceae bacterium]